MRQGGARGLGAGRLQGRGPRGGSSTGAYEWNKCARMYDLAAFTTHKREEVSVEELRAMQYMHSSR